MLHLPLEKFPVREKLIGFYAILLGLPVLHGEAFANALAKGSRATATAEAAVRAAPSPSSQLLGSNRLGTLGTIVDGPVTAGGTTWWKVDYEGILDGWSAAGQLGAAYFPPRESAGGWRSLVAINATPSAAQKASIRNQAGIDWDRLKLAHNYTQSAYAGSSLLVIRNGWIAGEWGSKSVTGVGSISKSLTGLTLAKLFDLSAAGSLPRRIGPDDFVHSYVQPEWSSKDARKKQIRVDHLLTMSSGLTPDDKPKQPDYLKLLLAQPVKTAPEREWSYQSMSVDLLGVAMQRLAGKPVRELFNQHIAARLGIANIPWDGFDGYTRASSGAEMAPRDLARIGYLMMMNGRWGSGSSQSQVVSAANVAYLRRGPACVQTAAFKATPVSSFTPDTTSNQFYGRLWWTNHRGTALGTNVPGDAFYALGLREKLLIVVPSLNLVVVRIGEAPVSSGSFRRELAKRVMAAVTTPTPTFNTPRVASMTLMNNATGKPVTLCDPMPADAVVDYAKLGTRKLSLRANTAPAAVGSLLFDLGNHLPAETKTNGNSGARATWAPSVGRHTVTVTPYASGGAAGLSLTQSYTVR